MKRILICMLVCLLCVCCAALAEEAAPEAALRGKTLIVRMPDGWVQEQMKNAEAHQGWWGDDGMNWLWRNRAAEWMLTQIGGGEISGSAVMPACMQSHDAELSLCHIDGSWYSVLRLREGVQGEKEAMYELCNLNYAMADGALSAKEQSCVTVELSLTPRNMGGAQPAYAAQGGGLRVQLFPALGATAAVIIEENADRDLLEDVQLTIGGDYGPLMNGYMDGKNAVYCCMLNDAEASALQLGAAAGLYRPSFAEDADFQGTEFAVAQKGTGGYGIVNAAGEWVVEPKYRYISRTGRDRCNWDTPVPFFCETDTSLTVIHGESLRVIAEIENASQASVGNPSVFTVYTEDGSATYCMITGQKLLSTNGPMAALSGVVEHRWVRPEYVYSVEGYPERLVIQVNGLGAENASAFLATNSGERVSGDYVFILPLIWSDGQGLYLTQNGSTSVLEFASMDFTGDWEYTREEAADTGWLCGLMDEDGNTVADCAYTGVRILGREEIQLQNARGEWERFFWMK